MSPNVWVRAGFKAYKKMTVSAPSGWAEEHILRSDTDASSLYNLANFVCAVLAVEHVRDRLPVNMWGMALAFLRSVAPLGLVAGEPRWIPFVWQI